jgi:protocatechuate 3,4-dioxygenase beta subunit
MTFDPSDSHSTTRRRFVLDVVGGLAGTALAGCGAGSELSTTRTGGAGGHGAVPTGAGGDVIDAGEQGGSGGGATGGASGDGTGGVSNATGGVAGAAGAEAGTCAMYPQQTEGPFYLDLDLLRSDITEGKTGAPLELEMVVIHSNGCAPMANAVVDVWQCDVEGVYAGFPGQLGGLDTTGLKFLRGTQITGADGRVVFNTVYPGWYPGRTTHIHFKVHLSATTEMTSQLYFPEDVTANVYQSALYAARGQKDTSNAADAIAQTGGMPPVLAVTQTSTGYKGRLVVTVLG